MSRGRMWLKVLLFVVAAGGSGWAQSPPAQPVPPTLAQMVTDAGRALQQGDVAGAAQMLDQVKAANDKEPGLWGTYGDLDARQHDLETAAKDYERELTLHPGMLRAYPALAAMQVQLNRRTDAMATLQRWVNAAPEDGRARIALAGDLLDDEKYAEAASEAESGLKSTAEGDSSRDGLRSIEGTALLRLGRTEQARTLLVEALKHTQVVTTINNIAYELANAGLELPLADEKMKQAVAAVEGESRAWTLEQPLLPMREGSALLQAVWDTLGWVSFREGKLETAEGYVKASWTGRPTEAVGKHLLAIQQARGEKAEAALTAKQVAQMGKANMAAVRHLPVGQGANGSADYKILLGPFGLMQEEAVGAATVADAALILVRIKTATLFPPQSQGQLVYLATLACSAGQCEVALIP